MKRCYPFVRLLSFPLFRCGAPAPAESGRITVEWGVAGIPESYLVDPDGVVRSKITGGVRAEGLDDLLARAKQADAEAGADR